MQLEAALLAVDNAADSADAATVEATDVAIDVKANSMCQHGRWRDTCAHCVMSTPTTSVAKPLAKQLSGAFHEGLRRLSNGDRVLREDEARTPRGVKYRVQLLRHAPTGSQPGYTVTASAGRGEYHTEHAGNAAMVFACFLAGVLDRETPLAILPGGLSRAMGRAWLEAEQQRCNPRAHVVGAAKACSHFSDGSLALVSPDASPGARARCRWTADLQNQGLAVFKNA